MRSVLKIAVCAVAILSAPVARADIERLSFSQLPGWAQEDHETALSVFLKSCSKRRNSPYVRVSDWPNICRDAGRAVGRAKQFFETAFAPMRITDGSQRIITGYFEPELLGSRKRGSVFQYPLYSPPPEVKQSTQPWLTRAQIENGALAHRGLEIAWLRDPVDNFFLHIQGSGRIRLAEGGVMRVGFAGRNHHSFGSVARYLARKGYLPLHQTSAPYVKDWYWQNPTRGQEALNHNKSFIFFQELTDLSPTDGPKGAMGVPLTAMRSIAVDPKHIPLGLPVYLSTPSSVGPLNRIMIAQDTGSAVKGAQRADLFFGSGMKAGQNAEKMRYDGVLTLLLPRAAANRIMSGK